MNPIRQVYHIASAVILILASVAGAQVASSVDAAPVAPPSSSTVSFSSNAIPPDIAVSRLRSALARSTYGSTNTSSGVFVVPAEAISVEDLAAINEDVNVMTRIFENKLRQANLLRPSSPFPIFVGTGYRSWATSGDSSRAMYLQGYGILFMMDVDFPLAPGPETEEAEEPAEPEADGDPVWANTRQEIYQPQRLDRDDRPEDSRPQYSAERVENLKATIIKALIHAANIRSLTPDESIIVTLTGSPASPTSATETIAIPGTAQIVVKSSNDQFKIVDGPLPENASTVVTIRAKGADIKAFANGQLQQEQFRQRVQVLSHPLLGAATTPPTRASSRSTSVTTPSRRGSGVR